jgi:hypothetical protein
MHRIGRPAVVETGERALVRFRPAWAKSRVLYQLLLLGERWNQASREYAHHDKDRNHKMGHGHGAERLRNRLQFTSAQPRI